MAIQSNERDLGKNIGQTIARYRSAAGFTQAQVAELLDVSIDAVSRMERGGIMPTAARLIQLAEIFGCTAADLITEGSPLADDQAKRLAALLAQLGEDERMELMGIIEQMVMWYVQGMRKKSTLQGK